MSDEGTPTLPAKSEGEEHNVIVVMDNAEGQVQKPQTSPATTLTPVTPATSIFPQFFINDNKWTEPASKLLLELYVEKGDKFNDPHMKKKQVWGEISDVLRSKGFMFDADKCERKFLNLKTVYRNTVHHNSLVRNFDRKCSFFDELEDIFHLAEKSKEKLKSGGGDDKMDMLPGQRAVPIRMFHASERQSMLHINSGKMSPGFTGSPREVSSTTFPPYKPQIPTIQRQNLNTQLRQKFSNRTVSSSSRHQEMSPPATPTMAHQQHDGLQRRNSNSDVYNDSYGESPHGTAIIDLCRESSASGKRASSDVTSSTPSKRQRPNDLQNLLESFETYRREQREREDERMKIMKELHEDEMRVTNRFLDIIQQCVQTSKTE